MCISHGDQRVLLQFEIIISELYAPRGVEMAHE